tara:strand:- start:9990 stop:10655 length:666 start_codon:yes stop_codon:yes gene_type:complete
MLEVLHAATLFRGEYAFSLLTISNKNAIKVVKQKDHPTEINLCKNTKFALGHNQAPTSAQRAYHEMTSHPFRSNDWIVGHNGVITNYKELTEKYCKWNKSPVDSAVIPSLLNQFSVIPSVLNKFSTDDETLPEIENISSVLSLLEGTFAVWILNEQSNSVYIARQGSTLFCNPKTGDFCSINSTSGNWIELIEGNIYKINLNTKKVKAVGKFANTTPYFTI